MNNSRRCLITGGHGYLGSELAQFLRGTGWQVVIASRQGAGSDEIAFRLGGEIPVDSLRGFDALIHCAYDFTAIGWEEIHRTNVIGTRLLLDHALAAGVKTIITISSISAYEGCRSLYGKAKLLIEQDTFARGGIVLRPGLIYGGSNRGMYGRLQAQAAKKIVPLMVGSPCTQYLIQVEDLARVVEGWLEARWPKPQLAWTVAHPEPWPLRKLLSAIAGDRKPIFLPVPWQPIWLGLKFFEAIGMPRAFKSDSVISIVNQNPHPDFSQVLASGIDLRGQEPGRDDKVSLVP